MSARSRQSRGRRSAGVRGDLNTFVLFEVGETCYGIDVSNVEEVTHPGHVTALPAMGASVAGVTDHRGRVTPIVELRPRFGLAGSGDPRHTKWILVRSAHGLVGFVVDRVLDVVSTTAAMGAAPHVGGMEDNRAIRGIVNIDGGLVFVLDENRLASVVGLMDLPSLDA